VLIVNFAQKNERDHASPMETTMTYRLARVSAPCHHAGVVRLTFTALVSAMALAKEGSFRLKTVPPGSKWAHRSTGKGFKSWIESRRRTRIGVSFKIVLFLFVVAQALSARALPAISRTQDMPSCAWTT